MGIVLIDATSDSLTVSWKAVPGSTHYVLQYRGEDGEYETLSDKLSSTQVKKRNLIPGASYSFRVKGSLDAEEWTESDLFAVLTKEEESDRMSAPTAATGVGNHVALIRWSAASTGGTAYELQMRENEGGAPWSTIAASLASTEVRKKNLTAPNGYQFRVRRASSSQSFSAPSSNVMAPGLSTGLARLFGSTASLESNGKLVDLKDALGGKEFVLLYASAHWCGPCRSFTPQLTKWYNQAKKNSNVEVVFLSADHDENSFTQYFQSMPWLAVPYEDDAREELMAHIKVTGIPRLVVLDGRTGRIIVDNAVGQPLDPTKWRTLLKK